MQKPSAMRGLTRPAWLPLPVTLPFLANHLAREGQVGEGVSPTSECVPIRTKGPLEVKRTTLLEARITF